MSVTYMYSCATLPPIIPVSLATEITGRPQREKIRK